MTSLRTRSGVSPERPWFGRNEGRRYTSERGPEGHPERWTHFILFYLANKGGGLHSEVVALLAEVCHTNDRS